MNKGRGTHHALFGCCLNRELQPTYMNLAACGGTFSTGLTGLTRLPRLSESDGGHLIFLFSLYPGHPVYPVQKRKFLYNQDNDFH